MIPKRRENAIILNFMRLQTWYLWSLVGALTLENPLFNRLTRTRDALVAISRADA
jgi:hypothetical protein